MAEHMAWLMAAMHRLAFFVTWQGSTHCWLGRGKVGGRGFTGVGVWGGLRGAGVWGGGFYGGQGFGGGPGGGWLHG